MKNQTKIIQLVFLVLCLLVANTAVSQTLIPFYKNGKYGYCNMNKEIVIKPQYDGCGFFNNGRAWFKKGNKFGYLNAKGRVVIPAVYSCASNFKSGLAIVVIGNRNYVINLNGQKFNKIITDGAQRVAGDSLIICGHDGLWYVIDKSFKISYKLSDYGTLKENKGDFIIQVRTNDDEDKFLNLKTGEFIKMYNIPFWEQMKNKYSLHVDTYKNQIGGLTIERYRILNEDDEVIIPADYADLTFPESMEIILCIDKIRNPGTSQIYFSEKKKLSESFPFLIEEIVLSEGKDPIGFQIINGKYYFLGQIKPLNQSSLKYICFDEDGKVYADF